MNFGEIVKFFVNIAKTIPGDLQECRLRLLMDFQAVIYELYKKCRNPQTEEAK